MDHGGAGAINRDWQWVRKSGRISAKRTEVLISPPGPLPVVPTLTTDGVQRDSERLGSCTRMTRLEFSRRAGALFQLTHLGWRFKDVSHLIRADQQSASLDTTHLCIYAVLRR